MNCWTTLGVPADADERTIKRSYAALLKVHRPDEDLEAFQCLREAYEQALSIARRRAEQNEIEESVGLESVVEQPDVTAIDQDLWGRIDASLGDLTPPTLEVAALQARDQGQLALFERCLLERCLTDNERGYAAAHWALACLHWLTPWQEPSLPGDQLDGLLNRLLATELHALHGLLAEGDEAAFQERLDVLFGQAWLQPFERRAYFNRQLVDVLLAVPCWSETLFRDISSRCQWGDTLAREEGWLQEWSQLQRRVELQGLHERITSRMALRKPDSPQARAAWLLFKPMSDGLRRRMVDGFAEKDWAACELLEETLLKEAPEVLAQLAPQGIPDWRKWLRSSYWKGAGICLWLLMLMPAWLQITSQNARYGADSPISSVLGVGLLSAALVGLLMVTHSAWRYCTGWLTWVDVIVSKQLLPASLTRQGTGVLILRHLLPSLAISGVAMLLGAQSGALSIVACATSGLVAFVYADINTRVGPPLSMLGDYLERFKGHLNKVLWVAGLGLVAAVIFLTVQHRYAQRLEEGTEYSSAQWHESRGAFELKVPSSASCEGLAYGSCELSGK
ncbi:J domain-containing protein [Pseudomonas sp. CAU 1711]|uniref:J domain-containing protein n=1 Tax=Pseudomonas sp. CAU 1711 TaxID=3140356 RepID=UPI0032616585